MSNQLTIFRVTLEVSDLTEAAAFYSQLLDIPGQAVGGGRYYFDCGSVILALLNTGQKPRIIPQYLYFSTSNIENAHARAKTLECLATYAVHESLAGEIITRPWGERSFYGEDPYGNGICFVDVATIFRG